MSRILGNARLLTFFQGMTPLILQIFFIDDDFLTRCFVWGGVCMCACLVSLHLCACAGVCTQFMCLQGLCMHPAVFCLCAVLACTSEAFSNIVVLFSN